MQVTSALVDMLSPQIFSGKIDSPLMNNVNVLSIGEQYGEANGFALFITFFGSVSI